MKITTAQLKQIIREEVRKMRKEGYEHITKNDGYTKDKTEPSEYTDDGADIYAAEKGEIKETKRLTLKSVNEAFSDKKVSGKEIADKMRKHPQTKAFASKVEKIKMLDRKSTRLNSSHVALSRMPSSA